MMEQREASERGGDRRIRVEISPDALEGLNRIIASKNEAIRFALLPFAKPICHVDQLDDPAHVHVHVDALALKYTNAPPKGGCYKKDDPIEWEIAYVDLDYIDWRAVTFNQIPDGCSMYDIDWLMVKDVLSVDEEISDVPIMTGFSFVVRNPKAKWKQNPELAAAVESAVRALLGC